MGVRLRYTILYGLLFLASGVGLLAIVAAFGFSETAHSVPAGQQPPAPATEQLRRLLAEQEEIRSRQLLLGVLLALLVSLVIALVLGRVAAGRVLRPLRTITAATRRISADNLHERLAVTGPADEVKALADTVDDLLGRLEESFAAQRRFVADASHELRTPLATMRASLDVAVAKPGPVPAETTRLADRLRAELDRVERLLEGFLLLARAQHGALDDRTAVSLAELARSALPADDGLEISGDLAEDAVTRGNPVLLARLVSNLIDNAVRHNVAGGWIRVTARCDGETATLTVASSGPVLDPAQVAGLGRPFQRIGADRTGGGTGLGLSIVAAVAVAHGGSLDLAARDEGGLVATVALPTAVAVPA
jgi:signal transduction histidine kinase